MARAPYNAELVRYNASRVHMMCSMLHRTRARLWNHSAAHISRLSRRAEGWIFVHLGFLRWPRIKNRVHRVPRPSLFGEFGGADRNRSCSIHTRLGCTSRSASTSCKHQRNKSANACDYEVQRSQTCCIEQNLKQTVGSHGLSGIPSRIVAQG